ncbi:hypothetical protein BDK51DRAFT_40904 [Blyttiomyces helicus]|uniref:Uncharacterized protein n=1 Tax=Blyttiomyces helicus TaxID=388810 RepID=A0A4P9WJU8_9FUNG|nr:hypothetical protein BDK51DRAFT_40904 [Blyttiomyces helicus]|eukprot:RKO92243.1 hypothetical protein BDK51DRAFT_40904 [Blyttiomyces helicus]
MAVAVEENSGRSKDRAAPASNNRGWMLHGLEGPLHRFLCAPGTVRSLRGVQLVRKRRAARALLAIGQRFPMQALHGLADAIPTDVVRVGTGRGRRYPPRCPREGARPHPVEAHRPPTTRPGAFLQPPQAPSRALPALHPPRPAPRLKTANKHAPNAQPKEQTGVDAHQLHLAAPSIITHRYHSLAFLPLMSCNHPNAPTRCPRASAREQKHLFLNKEALQDPPRAEMRSGRCVYPHLGYSAEPPVP